VRFYFLITRQVERLAHALNVSLRKKRANVRFKAHQFRHFAPSQRWIIRCRASKWLAFFPNTTVTKACRIGSESIQDAILQTPVIHATPKGLQRQGGALPLPEAAGVRAGTDAHAKNQEHLKEGTDV
jgi:hypothetical protein